MSTRPLIKLLKKAKFYKAQMFVFFNYLMRPSFRFIWISKWIFQSTVIVLSDCREFPPEQHCKLGLNDFLKSTIIIKQNVTWLTLETTSTVQQLWDLLRCLACSLLCRTGGRFWVNLCFGRKGQSSKYTWPNSVFYDPVGFFYSLFIIV